MTRFPRDAPQAKVLAALATLGFELIRSGNHLAYARQNPDGTRTTMTLPNHATIKLGALLNICRQAGVGRDEFLNAYFS